MARKKRTPKHLVAGTEPPRAADGSWTYEPFQDAAGKWYCGANRGSKHDSLPCGAYPKKGHPSRRCNRHKGAPPVHGMASRYGPDAQLQALIEAHRADPKLRNLEGRLAHVSAALELALRRIDEALADPEGNAPTVEGLLGVAESIARIEGHFAAIAERHERIVNGTKVRLLREGTTALAQRFGQLLTQHEGKKLTKDLIREVVTALRGGSS